MPCKIAILVPETGMVQMDWALQIADIKKRGRKIITMRGGYPLDQARNILVRTALEMGAEWIFFLDSDILLPKGTIERMIGRNRPLLSGLYKRKSETGSIWCCGIRNADGEAFRFTSNSDWEDELMSTDVVGAGCLLIHRKVFETISIMYPALPWFQWCSDRGYKPEQFPDPLMYNAGEDVYFCLLAKKCGFEVIIDTTIKCEHIATAYIGEKGVKMEKTR
jgi:glycosyltransferase involved in cell wall biosynthesis